MAMKREREDQAEGWHTSRMPSSHQPCALQAAAVLVLCAVDASDRGPCRFDADTILSLVPPNAGGTAPSSNCKVPVPPQLPRQRRVMPDAWLANAHRGTD